ncbi:MAG: glycosyltransferase family 4 protein [Planctomycetaceae bacterium]|jgi:glycosyltransferase involved in cell wall biosynthesis|nr:glycosyltransferase family 4 protein [Planctomycetaceae bacterium]MBT6486618.1 glycosyltransferase family 4 protein [Planctomycetaceae bacterium]MBT6498167.1 glycosyltransferase family 4 protein [Planctomycetaceae bacterium]
MKILLCHNYYQQRGGEDQSFEDEAWLLESHGHDVIRYTRHNDDITNMSRRKVATQTIWNRRTYHELRSIIQAERPDVMHCTNTFPLISPAAYTAARKERLPVVQALRNYRLLCPSATFLRDGSVCEACLGKSIPWPGVLHGCYRDSRSATAIIATMLTTHRLLKTWKRSVSLYYSLTQFARRKFVEGGFPGDRVAVKSNFIRTNAAPGDGSGGYVLFVGRISPEKGIDTLLEAWSRMTTRTTLKVVGDGPLAERVRQAANADNRIEWLGQKPLDDVLTLIGDAACLVMPSVWYETFGRTIAEAFSRGTPAIVSKMGAMQELVDHGRTGFHFEPGNADDLAKKIQQMLADPTQLANMRRAARAEFEEKYTAETNYRMLMEIYERVLPQGTDRSLVAKTTTIGQRDSTTAASTTVSMSH